MSSRLGKGLRSTRQGAVPTDSNEFWPLAAQRYRSSGSQDLGEAVVYVLINNYGWEYEDAMALYTKNKKVISEREKILRTMLKKPELEGTAYKELPPRLYHGSVYGFDPKEIKPGRVGVWLTDTEPTAKRFTTIAPSIHAPKGAIREGGGRVYRFSIKPTAKILRKGYWDGIDADQLVREAKKVGADLVAITRVRDIPETSDQYFLVINPSVLKAEDEV